MTPMRRGGILAAGWMAISFLVTYSAILLLVITLHGQGAAPTLSYEEGKLQPFVVTTIPEDATFVGISFRSIEQPNYEFTTGYNIVAGTGTQLAFDWKYVDCTLDDPEWPYCAKGEYEVRAWTEGPGANAPKTFSNMLRWNK